MVVSYLGFIVKVSIFLCVYVVKIVCDINVCGIISVVI